MTARSDDLMDDHHTSVLIRSLRRAVRSLQPPHQSALDARASLPITKEVSGACHGFVRSVVAEQTLHLAHDGRCARTDDSRHASIDGFATLRYRAKDKHRLADA